MNWWHDVEDLVSGCKSYNEAFFNSLQHEVRVPHCGCSYIASVTYVHVRSTVGFCLVFLLMYMYTVSKAL